MTRRDFIAAMMSGLSARSIPEAARVADPAALAVGHPHVADMLRRRHPDPACWYMSRGRLVRRIIPLR